MKNIFTRALALTIVFALCAVSAFAAPAFTTDGVVYDLEAGTIDVATNGYTAGKSATLLVVKDGANLASLAASDIIYIDQEDNLAATTQAWTDIPLADRIAALNAAKAEGAADITAVNVYIGGTDVTAAVPYADEDGNPLSVAVAEEEPEVTYTYAVTFNTASTEFASVDAAVAALVVTKNGSDGSTVTLTTADYTTDTATANTIKVLVGGEEVGSIAYTIAAPVVTYTYAVTFNTASTEFASVDAAVAALVVTKNGSDGSAATLTTADYTTDIATANTIKVLIGGEEVGSIAYTIAAPVEPPVTGKTGIAGTVKRRGVGTKYNNAAAALVVVANGTTIVGAAVTDANGAFEVEVPAGTYKIVVKYAQMTDDGFTNYTNTMFTGINVTEGATTTLATVGKDFVAVEKLVTGDATGDGVVTTADYGAVITGLANAAAAK